MAISTADTIRRLQKREQAMGSIPDECTYQGLGDNCDRLPTHIVWFVDPNEWLYYCREHAYEMKQKAESARSIEKL